MRDLNYMWKRLEGTKEEKAYLDKRFNEMSVKEQYVLEGAIQIIGIYTAADMINLTEQLSSFDFYYKATDEKYLGEYVAKHKEDASDSPSSSSNSFVDTACLSVRYKSFPTFSRLLKSDTRL